MYKGKSYVSNGVSVDVSLPGAESVKRTTVEGRLSKEAPYVGSRFVSGSIFDAR